MLVNLSKDEMSTILYVLEGYINPSDDYSYDPDFREDVDNIFERLEGVIDTFYDVRKCIIEGNDYADCVDTLVERMNPLNVTYPDVNYRELTPFEEEIEIQKYIRENDD